MRSLVPSLLLLLQVSVPAQQTQFIARIVDEFGRPLPATRIEVLLEQGGALVGECRTDSFGECVVGVAPLRRYIVRASYPNHTPRQAEILPPAGDISVSFTLVPTPPPMPERDPNAGVIDGVISGAVRSMADKPVASVMVAAWAGPGFSGADLSAADGSFRIRVPPGTYTVRSSGGLTTATSGVLEAAEYGAPVSVISNHVTGPVILYPGSFKLPTVNVTVVSSAGTPVGGAEVIASADWRSPSGINISMGGRRTTGPDGTVLISAAVPGTVTITANAILGKEQLAGSATAEVRDRPIDVVVTLGPAAQVSGRVEFVGRRRPLQGGDGLRVLPDPGRARDGYLSTDTEGLVSPDGEFVVKGLVGERCLVLRGVPPGWRLAEITHHGRPLDDQPLQLRPGNNVTGLVLRVEPAVEDMPQPKPCIATNR